MNQMLGGHTAKKLLKLQVNVETNTNYGSISRIKLMEFDWLSLVLEARQRERGHKMSHFAYSHFAYSRFAY